MSAACEYGENGECWNCGTCADPGCCDNSERCIPRCGTVIGFQDGEPVLCAAVEAIHGDALGMVGGHDFDAALPAAALSDERDKT